MVEENQPVARRRTLGLIGALLALAAQFVALLAGRPDLGPVDVLAKPFVSSSNISSRMLSHDLTCSSHLRS